MMAQQHANEALMDLLYDQFYVLYSQVMELNMIDGPLVDEIQLTVVVNMADSLQSQVNAVFDIMRLKQSSDRTIEITVLLKQISDGLSELANQPIMQPTHDGVGQSTTESIDPSINEVNSQSPSHFFNQSTEESNNQSINQPVIQSSDHLHSQSNKRGEDSVIDDTHITQQNNHPAEQPINQTSVATLDQPSEKSDGTCCSMMLIAPPINQAITISHSINQPVPVQQSTIEQLKNVQSAVQAIDRTCETAKYGMNGEHEDDSQSIKAINSSINEINHSPLHKKVPVEGRDSIIISVSQPVSQPSSQQFGQSASYPASQSTIQSSAMDQSHDHLDDDRPEVECVNESHSTRPVHQSVSQSASQPGKLSANQPELNEACCEESDPNVVLFKGLSNPDTVQAISQSVDSTARSDYSQGSADPSASTSSKPAFKPAKVNPLTLDPFQSQSIASLKRGQSVLVSAHTSAGKTVVAEYAIAMALRDKQRVIYTSPIKVLSNQKYRELYEEFNNVGLMTGDITINPSASCLVMTTEILLYRGSEAVREVSIVYGEIHYMRNKERGVMWEETIILVPPSVRFVFLSATIPDASEFACWIAKLHHQPVNVVYTDYRPTPCQHYLFPAGGDGLYLVVHEEGSFREDNFQKALAVMKEDEATAAVGLHDEKKGAGKKRKPQKNGEASDIYKIVKMCLERDYQPVIIFSFSKRECERHAQAMAKIDFSDAEERQLIDTIFTNATELLSDDDKQLPQVTNILPILRRGIGIHHSGLLPLLKEVIEILFQEGLLKCLFSTETFSMGLNMPAKTVVFTSVRKWDSAEFRIVISSEYIQMSGRAGRRGLDDRGVVICILEEAIEPSVAKSMLKGESDTLNSSFHLGYNMLLNLLRVEDQNPMKLMARSFVQFQSTRKTPAIQANVQQVAAELEAKQADIVDFNGVKEYAQIQDGLAEVESKMRLLWRQPHYVIPFLNPGRLLEVAIKAKDLVYSYDWCVMLHYQKKPVSKALSGSKGDHLATCKIGILAHAQAGTQTGKHMPNAKPEILVPAKRGLQGGQRQRMIIELCDIQAAKSVGPTVPELNCRSPKFSSTTAHVPHVNVFSYYVTGKLPSCGDIQAVSKDVYDARIMSIHLLACLLLYQCSILSVTLVNSIAGLPGLNSGGRMRFHI